MMIPMVDIERFFKETLEYPDWKLTFDKNKLEFLKELVKKITYHSYFHNIEMSSTSPENRKTPSLEDTIRIGLAGTGGVCIHQNAFMTFLLQELGFNAYMSAGNCIVDEPEAEGNHCMCILKLEDSKIYAIDVGCAHPTNEPIPLHNLPYSGVSAGFEYEYRQSQTTPGVYQRWHSGTFFHGKFDDPSKSYVRYSFTLEPKSFGYFEKTLVDIFTNASESIFLTSPFIFRCLDLENTGPDGINGRRFILIFGASLVIYDNINRDAMKFSSYRELIPFVLKYLPKIRLDLLEKSIGYFESGSELIFGQD